VIFLLFFVSAKGKQILIGERIFFYVYDYCLCQKQPVKALIRAPKTAKRKNAETKIYE
jgi:hypothetical protein